MGFYFKPKITTNGLIVSVDPSNQRSYLVRPTSAITVDTDVFDLAGGIDNDTGLGNFFLQNSPTVVSDSSKTSGKGGRIFWRFKASGQERLQCANSQTSAFASYNNLFPNGSGNFSIGCWWRRWNRGSETNTNNVIFSKGGGTGSFATMTVWWNNSTNYLRARIRGAGNTDLTDLGQVNDDNWHFTMLTCQSGTPTVKLYLDAGDNVVTLSNGTQGEQNQVLYFANAAANTALHADMDLGPLYIYNRPLSASEIQQNINAMKERMERTT